MTKRQIKELFLKSYDIYADEIFRHALFQLHDRERAKDVTQETFIHTWEYLCNKEEIDHIHAFLYRVADNLVIDMLRLYGRTISLEKATEQGLQFSEDTNRVDLEFAADARLLTASIDKLEPIYREAVILRYLQDLSVQDIAKRLGEKEVNISVRIHRAIEKLRTLCHVEP